MAAEQAVGLLFITDPGGPMQVNTISSSRRLAEEQLREVQVGRHGVVVSIRSGKRDTVPLLMCNGIGGGYKLWDGLREHLDRTTIAFDVRGAFLGRRPSVRTYGQFLVNMLEQLHLERVDVLGLSWGGIVAQQLAHDHPGRVRRLVLASSTPGFVSVPVKPGVALGLVTPRRTTSGVEKVVTKICGGDLRRDTELVGNLGLPGEIDKVTYGQQLLAVTGWSSLPWLRTVRHETLVLHGSDDPIVPVLNARVVAKLMPRATLEIVPDGGHLFLYTRPEACGRRIGHFLDGPSSDGSRPSRTGRHPGTRALGTVGQVPEK